VWEWCRDGQRAYAGQEEKDPVGSLEKKVGRVVRGGSWLYDARDVRAAFRYADVPGSRYSLLGFRCARVQEPGEAEPGHESDTQR
jgi:formylglycine-generating enzyme required for sulfatase activity